MREFSQEWRALSARFRGCEFNTFEVLQQDVARDAHPSIREKHGFEKSSFIENIISKCFRKEERI